MEVMTLTRAEKRRAEKVKTATYNLTKEQIDNIKREAVDEATLIAMKLLIGLPIMANRDLFGHGKKRLEQLANKIFYLFDSYEKGYISMEDIDKTILEETGMTISQEK